MCGIVGAVAERNVVPVLIEGLRRLEYRGYDSAGIAVIDGASRMERVRTPGKVAALQALIDGTNSVTGQVGIAHTRWATHGEPNEQNAHPHIGGDRIAVVHNGIIENHAQLRAELIGDGYAFTSDTDTEVIANLICKYCESSKTLVEAVQKATNDLEGAYAIGVVSKDHPDRIIAARAGSPGATGATWWRRWWISSPSRSRATGVCARPCTRR